MTDVPRQATIDALADVWSNTRALLGELSDDEWTADTCLPTWNVKDNVSHVIGTEAMLLDIPAPPIPIDRDASPHVRNDIGEFNEQWVRSLHDAPPAEIMRLFDEYTSRRLAALATVDDARWSAETFTPGGRDTYGRFMRIRTMDCWFHEQDIRSAVDRPGHTTGPAVETTLDEIADVIGYAVGKKAGVPAGNTVTFELTGESARTIHVDVSDRARVVESLDGPASITVRIPMLAFTRLCGGRADGDALIGSAVIEGDTELGAHLVRNLAFMI